MAYRIYRMWMVIAALAAMSVASGAYAQSSGRDPVLRLLLSKNPERVEEGLAQLRALLQMEDRAEAGGPLDRRLRMQTLQAVRYEWLPQLQNYQRHDAMAEVALLGLLSVTGDNLAQFDYFAHARTEALLKAGRPAEALSAAKSYYNACRLWSVPKAVELVAQALDAAHGEDPQMSHRFKLEQLDGGDPETAKDLGPGVLGIIQVDPSLYKPMIRAIVGQGYHPRCRRGNLLLMADLPDEARVEFEAALGLARSDPGISDEKRVEMIHLAQEGVARSIRAADGVVAWSHAYMLQGDEQRTSQSPTEGLREQSGKASY